MAPETFFQEFPKYGLSGLVILGLILVVRALWLKFNEVQDARIKEGLRALEIIQENTAQQERSEAELRSLKDLLRAQKGGI